MTDEEAKELVERAAEAGYFDEEIRAYWESIARTKEESAALETRRAKAETLVGREVSLDWLADACSRRRGVLLKERR